MGTGHGKSWASRMVKAAVVAGVCMAAGAWLMPAPAAKAGPVGGDEKRNLQTMTANLYVGTDISMVAALDPMDPNYYQNLVGTVAVMFQQIQESQPEARMKGIAAEILRRKPDTISVQEVSLIRIQMHGDLLKGGTTPATTVVYDYLDLLVKALNAQGGHYAVASQVQEVDVELPMYNPTEFNPDTGTVGDVDDVRLTDRDVILVRTDLPRDQLRVSNPKAGNFDHVLTIPSMGLEMTRGWCAVDLSVRGQNIRYICTHLEQEIAPPIQAAQVSELLAGPANVKGAVVICGDLNSDPLNRDGSLGLAHDTVTSNGFADTWLMLHPSHVAGGLTWGHDSLLADPEVAFDRRIDFVFYRGNGLRAEDAEVIDVILDDGRGRGRGRGADKDWPQRGRGHGADKRDADAPLWGSDHAALYAELRL